MHRHTFIHAAPPQGACLDLLFDTSTCAYRPMSDGLVGTVPYLYCDVCLGWPRPGGDCSLDPAGSMDYVCAGDELSRVLDPVSWLAVLGCSCDWWFGVL